MNENDFWNNLDNFVDRENKKNGKGVDKVGSWLSNNISDNANTKSLDDAGSVKNATGKPEKSSELATSPRSSSTPNTEKSKKAQISTKDIKKNKLRQRKPEVNERKVLASRKYIRKSKLLRRRRRARRYGDSLYFGPQVECNFNLSRGAINLEKLMGSSVVRLTDRKFMLELQRRIQEHYKDRMTKRISGRQNMEVDRMKKIDSAGISSSSEPSLFNLASCNLALKKREKLKTIREKNAERLIKQGKRWEKERLHMEEQERIKENAAKKERERMLEEQTLYVFDGESLGTDILRMKNRKLTECEIDVKNFLLSERNDLKKRSLATDNMGSQEEAYEKLKKGKKEVEISLDEIDESETQVKNNDSQEKKDFDMTNMMTPSIEEIKKKSQGKKDEDPMLTKFKDAETVKDIYDLAEALIAGDGEQGRKKLW